MHIRYLCVYSIIFVFFQAIAQRAYYDKQEKKVSGPENAYFYCEYINDSLKCRYSSNNKLYFQGKVISKFDNFRDYKFSGKCYWYYKDGTLQSEKNFNDKGQLDGEVIYYNESGDVDKIYLYVNGKMKDNFYYEYDQDKNAWKVYSETFENNKYEWDLNEGDKDKCEIKDKTLILCSFNENGTSRWISIPHKKNDFIIESKFKMGFPEIKKKDKNSKYCLLFGFKDWSNYCYYCIDNNYILSLGYEYEGIQQKKSSNIYASVSKEETITMKVLNFGEKIFFSLNGDLIYSTNSFILSGDKIGYMIIGKNCMSVHSLILKSRAEDAFANHTNIDNRTVKGSGTGFLISENGYIVTCYHVVEGSKEIFVEIKDKDYPAQLVSFDKENDIAILKVKNITFDTLYIKFNDKPIQVSEEIFTLGYPLALAGMGNKIKYVDGKISSKTGYNNSIHSFQTTLPVQPGNSGSPVFNQQGQLIGLINAKIKEGDNVSYVIKSPLINNLLLSMDETPSMHPQDISNKSKEEKIKDLSQNIFLIKIK